MGAIIQEILLFLLFSNFPKTILSKNSCPSSSCGAGTINYLPIKYPFKLQTDPLPEHCQDYINLKCNNQGQTVINLPSCGDFNVIYIDYYTRKIYLSDPENCLPRKLMKNCSAFPLEAFRYENYTYFQCPRKNIMYRFGEIKCQSNSMNVTVASAALSSKLMEEMYGCRTIVSSMIPVSWTTEDDFGDLQLTWNVSDCKDCVEEYDAENSDDSRSEWEKLNGSPIFIPSVITLLIFFGVACSLRVAKLVVTIANTNNTTEENSPPGSTTAGTSTTIAPPQTTSDMPSAPLETSNGTVGIDASKLKNCTELVVLCESQGISLPTSLTCSICLEEYHGEEKVRYLPRCGHYFHVECLDQWLQKNKTCPVCRTTLSE